MSNKKMPSKKIEAQVDTALQWLTDRIREQARPDSLWCIDESGLGDALDFNPTASPNVITNRFDVNERAQALGLESEFSDFDFNHIPDESVSQVFYRVSKEKPVTHHVINHAARMLKNDGQLFLCGLKNEGIKTYVEKASKRLGKGQNASKQGSTYTSILNKTPTTGPELDDSDYAQPRLVGEQDSVRFYSKPGLFGWQKIDRGSEFLWDQVEPALANRSPKSLLDLGCGYGYLGLMSKGLMSKSLPLNRRVLTDNNAAAIAMSKYNLEMNSLDAEVIAADCAQGIDERFDLILCNPPFHQGFSVSGDLTDRFLKGARDHLADQGLALFVVNAFIPLEKVAAPYFKQVETLANNDRFKVIALSGVKASRAGG